MAKFKEIEEIEGLDIYSAEQKLKMKRVLYKL